MLAEHVVDLLLEMPQITRKGKTAYADGKPLRDATDIEVKGNIVIIRQPTANALVPEGFTLVYFMDSDESAAAMKAGKLPYKFVHNRPRFSFDASPITDVWKGQFDKGQKAILGVLQGTSDENEIYVDKMTVRPAYKRNTIMRRLLGALQASFPKAKVNFSGPTKEGAAFIRGTTGSDWVPAHGETPEF